MTCFPLGFGIEFTKISTMLTYLKISIAKFRKQTSNHYCWQVVNQKADRWHYKMHISCLGVAEVVDWWHVVTWHSQEQTAAKRTHTEAGHPLKALAVHQRAYVAHCDIDQSDYRSILDKAITFQFIHCSHSKLSQYTHSIPVCIQGRVKKTCQLFLHPDW